MDNKKKKLKSFHLFSSFLLKIKRRILNQIFKPVTFSSVRSLLNDRNVLQMYSDAWFTHAAYTSIRDYLEKQSSPIYYYYFAYRGSASFSRIFGDREQNYGVSHADELQYLFPVGEQLFKDTPLSEKDHEMVDIITSLWYNFANSG